MSAPVRRSPLAREHAELGASFEIEAGWEIPAGYGDEAAERAALHDGLGLADITARAKVDVRGDLEAPIAAAGDALVARVGPDWALVLGEPGAEEAVLPNLESAAGPGAMVTDVTHLFGGLALGGPRLGDALARLTSWDPSTLPPGAATGAPIGDVRAIVVRRELPFALLEIYVATEYSCFAWETLLDVVSRLDGQPVGWRSLRAQGWR